MRRTNPREGIWGNVRTLVALAIICVTLIGSNRMAWAQQRPGAPAVDGSPATVTSSGRQPARPGKPGFAGFPGIDLRSSLKGLPVLNARAAAPLDWCQTQVRWNARAGNVASAALVCPTQGSCDIPAVRDGWIPDESTPIVTICVKFNVFANDDGSNPAATQADVDAQMVQLNSDYLPSRIQFEATTEIINDTTYRQFSDSEEFAMKSLYADNPGGQLNVYVVNILAGYLGVGTFVWDPSATGTQGGIIVDDNWFGAGQKTLTHEAGHNLGLWHTHHGVSQVPNCSSCYERADGVNGDTTGDFAADTAPTPTNFSCGPPGGTDPCSGVGWGPTDPQNYMGYATDSCYTKFSPQQFGRFHCWIDAVLTGWYCATGCTTPAECDDGNDCTEDFCEGGACTHLSADFDTDRVPDACDNCPLHANRDQADCDADGTGDVCTIADCAGDDPQCSDCNGNGIPDECDTISGGDFDGNGVVGLGDWSAFVDCMAGPSAPPNPSASQCAEMCLQAFDLNGDNVVDIVDGAELLVTFAGP